MAQYHDYRDTKHDRINYGELNESRVGSKAILIILALMAAAVVAMFLFGDVTSTTSLEGSAPAGTIDTAPPPPTAPVLPATGQAQ